MRIVVHTVVLKAHREMPASIEIFDFGKYRGLSHHHVAGVDPSYVCWAYERVEDHAGISESTYAAACRASGLTRQQRDLRHRQAVAKRLRDERPNDESDEWEDLPEEPRTWGDL